MSIDLESMMKKPCSCFTVLGDVYCGTMEAVDSGFNVVLSSAYREGKSDAAEPLTFVRGDNVVYVAFDDTKPHL